MAGHVNGCRGGIQKHEACFTVVDFHTFQSPSRHYRTMATEDGDHAFADLGDPDETPQDWLRVRQREAELKKSLHLNELRMLAVWG